MRHSRRCVVLRSASNRLKWDNVGKGFYGKIEMDVDAKKNVFEDAETGKWFIIDWRKERLILVILDKIRNK